MVLTPPSPTNHFEIYQVREKWIIVIFVWNVCLWWFVPSQIIGLSFKFIQSISSWSQLPETIEQFSGFVYRPEFRPHLDSNQRFNALINYVPWFKWLARELTVQPQWDVDIKFDGRLNRGFEYSQFLYFFLSRIKTLIFFQSINTKFQLIRLIYCWNADMSAKSKKIGWSPWNYRWNVSRMVSGQSGPRISRKWNRQFPHLTSFDLDLSPWISF